jgi:hypothetical protein
MMDYYQVLGLPPTASASQIKAAYRKLVQQYHPDVNPSPNAHVLIQEINEAYDVLGDSVKRTTYDNQRNGVYITLGPEPAPAPRHRDPAYRRTPRPAPPQESAQEVLMKKCLPFILKLSWVGCFTCLILFVDRVWSPHVTVTEIHSFLTDQTGRTITNYVITNEGRILHINGADWEYVEQGQAIEIVESGLLKEMVSIWLPEPGKTLTNFGSLYRNYLFVPLILLIVSVLGVMPFKSVEMRFNIGIMLVFVLIFTWILILK